MTPLVDKVYHNIQKHSLLSPGSRVLVAVSGGADSVALLQALNLLRHNLGISIVVAHYNHALRASAIQDQKFVEQLAEKLGLSCVTEMNRKKSPSKGSVEEFARNVRYDFLLRTARRVKADAVAVAHTQDDLAETVLMRILRGTGLSGLRSMSPKRVVAGVDFIRPLLNISRLAVEHFLKSKRSAFIQDPTNRSLEFTRNKIRLHLIPYIEKGFAPDVKDRLVALADIACVEEDFIEEAGCAAWPRLVKIGQDKIVVKSEEFQVLHRALRRVLLRMVIAALKGVAKPWDLRHVDMMDTFVCSKSVGTLALPQGFVLRKTRGGRTFAIQNT